MDKVKGTLSMLATLGLASGVLAQQTSPPPEPPTSTAPQEPPPPSASSNANRGEPNIQSLMADCMRQVQAANPSEPESEIKQYCDKQVKAYAPH
jgi:hypothetical protein